MGAVAQLKPKAPSGRSPERARLAALLERRRGLAAYIARIDAARDQVDFPKYLSAWVRAEDDLEEARKNEVDHVTISDRLLGEPRAGVSITDAEAAFAAATERKNGASRDAAALDQRRGDFEQELRSVEISIAAAIATVVRVDPATAALLREHETAIKALSDLSYCMAGLPPGSKPDGNLFPLRPDDRGRQAQWRAAVEALSVDADAQLPSLSK
jgi:hypothetical protein